MPERKPDFSDPGPTEKPRDGLDVYDRALDSPDEDDFLSRNNLGLGYYEDSERWQQVEAYRFGMFGDAAFGDQIIERAVEETKRMLARQGKSFYDESENVPRSVEGWDELDDEEQDEKDKRRYIEEKGEQIWKALNDEQRKEALEVAAGIDRQWTPPHWRMLLARHETSRSRSARLLDNLFGRETVRKVLDETESKSGRSLLPGGK